MHGAVSGARASPPARDARIAPNCLFLRQPSSSVSNTTGGGPLRTPRCADVRGPCLPCAGTAPLNRRMRLLRCVPGNAPQLLASAIHVPKYAEACGMDAVRQVRGAFPTPGPCAVRLPHKMRYHIKGVATTRWGLRREHHRERRNRRLQPFPHQGQAASTVGKPAFPRPHSAAQAPASPMIRCDLTHG
jgi:hypothetical protein